MVTRVFCCFQEDSGAQITIGKPEPKNPTDRVITIKVQFMAVIQFYNCNIRFNQIFKRRPFVYSKEHVAVLAKFWTNTTNTRGVFFVILFCQKWYGLSMGLLGEVNNGMLIIVNLLVENRAVCGCLKHHRRYIAILFP